MRSATLPPLPSWASQYRWALIGNSARQRLFKLPVHAEPELLVEATHSDVESRVHSLQRLTDDTFRAEGWSVRFTDGPIENALLKQPLALEGIGLVYGTDLVDERGGRDMVRDGILRASATTIEKNHLAGLQIIALASETRCTVDSDTLEAIRHATHRVYGADRASVRHWLTRLLLGRNVYAALGQLQQSRLLAFLLPEVDAFVGFHRSSPAHHKDVWDHTRQVVRQALPRPVLRWAALLHDIGKVQTRTMTNSGKIQFLRHDEVGAYLFDGIARRLDFESTFSAKVRQLILYHLRPAMYHPSWSDGAVKRFAAQLDSALPELLELARADITTRRLNTRRKTLHRLFELRQRIANLRDDRDVGTQLKLPRGLGADIIRELGVTPGPKVGDLRKVCEAALKAGDLPAGTSAAQFIEYLKKGQLDSA